MGKCFGIVLGMFGVVGFVFNSVKVGYFGKVSVGGGCKFDCLFINFKCVGGRRVKIVKCCYGGIGCVCMWGFVGLG